MNEIAAGPIVSRIRDALDKAAEEILKLSLEQAEHNVNINKLKDEMALQEANIRADVSTAINKETGRPRFPNIDSQTARVTIELGNDAHYKGSRERFLEMVKDQEINKAQLVRLHEKRRDARTEADLVVGLLRNEA